MVCAAVRPSLPPLRRAKCALVARPPPRPRVLDPRQRRCGMLRPARPPRGARARAAGRLPRGPPLMLLPPALQDDLQLQARVKPREHVAAGVHAHSPWSPPLSPSPWPALAGLGSVPPSPFLALPPCRMRRASMWLLVSDRWPRAPRPAPPSMCACRAQDHLSLSRQRRHTTEPEKGAALY